MDLLVDPSGQVRAVYGEDINLAAIGKVRITRASHVEPDETGRWWADLSPVDGPVLGSFQFRRLAVEAEVTWLESRLPSLTRP